MKKIGKKYTLQDVAQLTIANGLAVADIKKTVDSHTKSINALIEMVGTMAVEQTVIKDDIAGLKQDVGGLKQGFIALNLKTDGITNDVRALRVEVEEFKEETANNFSYVQDDLKIIAEHEVRIAVLEGQPIESLGI